MFASVGSWTPKITTITAAQMTAINANMQNAWDIIGGLTYTPVVQSVLTGTVGLKFNFSATGLQIAGLGGLHILSGSTGYVDSGGFLVANGAATFNDAITVSATGAITTNAASTTTLNGPLIANGTATLNGATSVGAAGTLTTNAAAASTFNGTVEAANVVSLTMAQPAKNADPGGNNRAYSTNIAKAWARITTDGVGGYTIDDGFNVASCTVAATYVEVTWARAFANANYAPVVTAGIPFLPNAVAANVGFASQTTALTRIYFWDIPGAATLNPATNGVVFMLSVFGRQ